MGKVWRFLKHSAALKWSVVQSLADYRWRSRGGPLTDAQRAEWLHEWCVKCLARLDITYSANGQPPPSGLIVCNHLSYLDILVFSAITPSVFVSKAEVKGWPVFGTLATLAGTVYVDRTRRTDTRNANEGIGRALEQGLRVVVFPEGGSSDGSDVLPFYASLFEPAMERAAPITAAYLSYAVKEGSVAEDVAYWRDMTFFPHLLKLLAHRGVSAEVRFSDTPRTFTDRKLAAAEMRAEVLRLRG